MTLLLLILIYVALFFGVSDFKPIWTRLKGSIQRSGESEALRRSVLQVRALQDQLETGLLPNGDDWQQLRLIPDPWGKVFYQTVIEARDRGAPILPSLKRMQRLLEEQIEWMTEAQAKLAPATGQAVMSLFLVPMFAAALYFLLPGLERHRFEFGVAVLFSFLLGLLAFYWMSEMGEEARFGKVRSEYRSWIASSVIALERLNSLVMVGQPADLAWNQTLEELRHRDPKLALHWGSLVWMDGEPTEDPITARSRNQRKGSATESVIIHLGWEVKRLIQTSLIEGQATLERVESVQRVFLCDLRGRVQQELGLLGNRCLKPLFILVMPAIVIVMAVGIGLCVQDFL